MADAGTAPQDEACGVAKVSSAPVGSRRFQTHPKLAGAFRAARLRPPRKGYCIRRGLGLWLPAVALLAILIVWADGAAAQRTPFRAPPEWSQRTIALDDLTISGRRVASGDSLMQVLLADGTTFTLAAGSELTIDSYAFDAAAGSARIAASLRRGAVRFLGGKTGDRVAIDTRFGTLVVDNAMADIDLGGETGPPHFDMIFGKGIRLMRGDAVIARVFEPGYSIAPAGDGRSAKVRKTPAEWKSSIQRRLASPRS